jgi:hypothetical protein
MLHELLPLLAPLRPIAWQLIVGLPLAWPLTGALALIWFPKQPLPGETPFWWQPSPYSDRAGLPNPAHPIARCLWALWLAMASLWLAAYAALKFIAVVKQPA